MSDVVKPIRSRTVPVPPAAGQFGWMPSAASGEAHGSRPTGCPSLEQFEARYLYSNDPHHPPRAA
ncbi:hypothetical protein ACFSCW_06100 [Sphingomonas tabacisoli]|uniref:Uncharacterized protein n=1 Tax=Sphingomonas tabacisoli TaxID=2249466 RepID=A0ABW4I1Q7_9SPHN